MNPPKRTNTHEIDTLACSIIATKINRNWEIRELTGRDFGVDRIVERFEDGFATSEILMLQIKGTETEIDTNNPRFSLETKTLLYAEMFSVPFILGYCEVTHPEKCYYLWLQEYIRVRLNYDNPNWRNQGTNTLYFPKNNILGTDKAEDHLTYIAKFPKFKTSWLSYYIALNELCYDFPNGFVYDEMDKVQVDELIRPAVSKLEDGWKKIGEIPMRFIQDNYQETISLGKMILADETMPEMMIFWRFISNCINIQNSVGLIALRFDASHMRILYECEGTADY